MRVLVTRPEPDATRTGEALARAGHLALAAPVLAIHPVEAPLPHGAFDAVAATSHHAFSTSGALDRSTPVYAVGARTAAAARAAGFRDVRRGGGDAAGLVDLLRLTLPRSARRLYRTGRDRKPALETTLAAAGYALAAVEVYRAEPAAHWPVEVCDALRAETIDIALHYSRRSAALALDFARREGLADALSRLRHLCLSADAAAPLVECAAAHIAVAERPEEAALLAMIPAEP